MKKMNKYSEALDELLRIAGESPNAYNIKQQYTALQELVDKATPYKPKLYKPMKTFNGSDIEQPFYIIKCGKCEYWIEPSDKFCSYCGTEIDWSKDE